MSTPFFGRLSIHLDRQGFKPPHLFSKTHVGARVWQKIVALVPLIVVSCAVQGWPAVQAFSMTVCGALLAEAAGACLFRRIPAYHEGESILIGLFCALVLPQTLSIWFFFFAAFIAVFAGREIFGGFGQAFLFPPAVGLLTLFLGMPSMIQAFDFKEARSLASAVSMEAAGHLNPVNLLLYPGSAASEDVSFFALGLGAIILLGCGLVRWELPILGMASYSVIHIGLEKCSPGFLLSGGLWLTLFWGLTQTSSMPLTPTGRRIYAVLTGLFAALCPLGDGALRLAAGLAAASLLSPWLDSLSTLKNFQKAGAA